MALKTDAKRASSAAAKALAKSLQDRIGRREATVAVIGLGYVGLPLLIGFHGKGFPVLGVDIDGKKTEALLEGKSYIKHIPPSRTAELPGDRFHATTDFSALAKADAVLICVPTPLTKHLEPDMTYIVSTGETMAPHLRKGQLVVLESTTYPGTTEDLLRPILEKGSGLKANEDFFLGYSPEREDPGNPNFATSTIPKVVGASTPEALEVTSALYSSFVARVVPVSSPETAEAVKLTENIFRAVNIAMVNELKVIYEAMGIDIWEVIEAAKSKPFGFMPFYPGPGLGGHCIPIDPFYLTWKAREYGRATRFIELAGEVNRNMPAHVVGRLRDVLSERHKKALNGARILVLGLAYKKNVDDLRESPSLTLIELLEAAGATADYHDPFISEIMMTREHKALVGRRSKPLTGPAVANYDAVLVSTDHDDIDYRLVVDNARLVIDTRNACARTGIVSPNIVKA